MPKMCKHRTTGEVYPYNVDLARHADIEVVDEPDPQFAAAAQANPEATIGDLQEQAQVEEPVVEPEPAPKKPAPKKKAQAKRKPPAKSKPASAVGVEDSTEVAEPAGEDPLADIDLEDV